MEQVKDGGPASCAWCSEAAHIKQGRILLCQKHYRFSSMRSTARRHGKSVPTREELDSIVPAPFDCFGCGVRMSWLRGANASTQATLQHDRSGAIRLLCLGCNTRHAAHPGDTFYEIPKGEKLCPDCNRVMPLERFSIDRSRPLGRKSYCRPCSSERHKQWKADAMLKAREANHG